MSKDLQKAIHLLDNFMKEIQWTTDDLRCAQYYLTVFRNILVNNKERTYPEGYDISSIMKFETYVHSYHMFNIDPYSDLHLGQYSADSKYYAYYDTETDDVLVFRKIGT